MIKNRIFQNRQNRTYHKQNQGKQRIDFFFGILSSFLTGIIHMAAAGKINRYSEKPTKISSILFMLPYKNFYPFVKFPFHVPAVKFLFSFLGY